MLSSLLVAICCLLHCVSGCSMPSEWKRLSYEQLMYRFDLVVIGTDLRHIFSFVWLPAYDSEFRVTCVLKGDNKEINETITIFGVSPLTSCFPSKLIPGNDYIVGLQRDGDGYKQHDVNGPQISAFSNTTENLDRALKVCGVQNPRLPYGTEEAQGYSFCSNPNPTEPCSGKVKDTLSFQILQAAFLSCLVLIDYFPILHQT